MLVGLQDMLEVGMVEEPANSPELLWNRAHFGGWAVSSSPLILGVDLSDTKLLQKIAPIITNTEAIEVNQVGTSIVGLQYINRQTDPLYSA